MKRIRQALDNRNRRAVHALGARLGMSPEKVERVIGPWPVRDRRKAEASLYTLHRLGASGALTNRFLSS